MVFTEWSTNELLTFFMVLVRMSVLLAVLPFFGDKIIPGPVKILLSIAMSVVFFPILRENGSIHINDAAVWGASFGTLLGTVVLEILVALVIGFTAQLMFQTVAIAGDIIGQLMGLSSASIYDPHTESQTVVLGQVLTTLGMLAFLSINGHHMLIRAIVECYREVGIGAFAIQDTFKAELLRMTGNTIGFGFQLAAPVTVAMLLINIIYGILAKALPQLNILTLSMAASMFVGLFVIAMSYPAIHTGMIGIFDGVFDDLRGVLHTLRKGA